MLAKNYSILKLATIYCKSFEVEKCRGFHGLIGNHETFLVKSGFGHTELPSNCECFPANYSLVLHTAKLFHLKRFAIYNIYIYCSLNIALSLFK